ncbi:hypothetical protein MELA_00937 [Candidatus Methylomirabilis lanthanidiphila]|uniref:Mut7-C RNAse domain-containing protein n=1 Tax=Candidatus Methylomirabilis lanthanidiphila TaxID=2211376 RepID=A0A564ZGZ5_9BACT|nr:Mut7-C RNAse domain-containing protein [Candidatus Methylomirabilis lanthanidiphila]VUZ84564.1 hypothetical protein MELA_00937 [Candidatus Methylomirabilis lanthanidiphila]
MRFVADAMLGRLAKWLRLVGYDTLYWRGDDAGLVRLVLAENRLLLTRDTRIAPRLPPHLTFFITSDHCNEQLDQVMARFGLPSRIGCLCLRCNLPLESAEKEGLHGEIPEFVWRTQERFARCPGCLRIYWEGTHYARMMETIERMAAVKMKGSPIDLHAKGSERCA